MAISLPISEFFSSKLRRMASCCADCNGRLCPAEPVGVTDCGPASGRAACQAKGPGAPPSHRHRGPIPDLRSGGRIAPPGEMWAELDQKVVQADAEDGAEIGHGRAVKRQAA